MVKDRILIIDDEKNICRSLEMILSAEGFRVKAAGTAKEALSLVKEFHPEIIFLDVLLPDRDGLLLLNDIKAQDPDIQVIMISGHATLTMAVAATKAGAYDFLEKPLQKDRILLAIKHLLQTRQLQDQYQLLQKQISLDYQMIGNSQAMVNLQEQIRRVAITDSKVLILGESGTGKELAAWAIHQQSFRRLKPFIKMNCAAIPEDLTESELFGHEKGSFTGALATRDGKFLQADGGTLFLDEIADMSLRVQTKVLRVLQDGKFERVGGKDTLEVNVRVLAATNRNLEELVKQEQFREDLYYRLNVFPIRIPPLRERKEDIPLLVQHFIKNICEKNNRKTVHIDPEALKILQEYHWPGNIRELQNIMERLIILAAGGKIEAGDLPISLQRPVQTSRVSFPEKMGFKEWRENSEREFIRQSLDTCGWNISETAKLLGIERTNLHKKMKALGIRKGKS
jgi:two-component system nitrogen regulation response regulator NtrX